MARNRIKIRITIKIEGQPVLPQPLDLRSVAKHGLGEAGSMPINLPENIPSTHQPPNRSIPNS